MHPFMIDRMAELRIEEFQREAEGRRLARLARPNRDRGESWLVRIVTSLIASIAGNADVESTQPQDGAVQLL